MVSRFIGTLWLIVFSMILLDAIQKDDTLFIIISSIVLVAEIVVITIGKDKEK